MLRYSKMIEFKGLLSFLILHELSKKSLCGEDLAKKIGRRKGSQLTPGTIYPALKSLRELGVVSFDQFGRKKMYSLTLKGKKELSKQYDMFSTYFYGLKSYIKRPAKKTKNSKQKL